MKIQLYDTTLRDGVQGYGIEYSSDDALRVVELLDRLGLDYIEFCNYDETAPSEADRRLSEITVCHAELTIFGSTCHPGEDPKENARICAAASSGFHTVTVFGKASLFQVTEILHTSAEENLRMIRDTVSFLTGSGKKVIFDAEHFFDGYADNPGYSVEVLKTALEAGADTLILCDTNGGMLPDAVGLVTSEMIRRFPGGVRFGIHCHNDIGMAEADSLEAVLNGAVMVQGSVSGMGERCGNANLNTLIPLLQLKLGYTCITPRQMEQLTPTVRRINELANRAFDENEPFVGSHAFTHKAGMHIDGVNKNPRSFEHIDPGLVGNERNYLASRLSGRAAALKFLHTAIPELTELDKNSEDVISASL